MIFFPGKIRHSCVKYDIAAIYWPEPATAANLIGYS